MNSAPLADNNAKPNKKIGRKYTVNQLCRNSGRAPTHSLNEGQMGKHFRKYNVIVSTLSINLNPNPLPAGGRAPRAARLPSAASVLHRSRCAPCGVLNYARNAFLFHSYRQRLQQRQRLAVSRPGLHHRKLYSCSRPGVPPQHVITRPTAMAPGAQRGRASHSRTLGGLCAA